MAQISAVFRAEGMHCPSCDRLIERAVHKIHGIQSVSARYPTQKVQVVYDDQLTSQQQIVKAIDAKGYQCQPIQAMGWLRRLAGTISGLLGIALILFVGAELVTHVNTPDLRPDMSYGLLFLVGLLTGFHCIGMCGGFVIGYTAQSARLGRSTRRAHLAYGLGKVISYTAIGALFGLLGAIIAFTPYMRGMAALLAGVFLCLYGLNMLNILPLLRYLSLRTPKWAHRFVGRESRHPHSPLVIGLLNGLMIACGPLQAMYIMAAGTGSALQGAQLLLVFGLGTLPLLLGFGALTSVISGSLTHRILQASGLLVVFLGLMMLNRGLLMTGSGYDLQTVSALVETKFTRLIQQPVETELEDGFQVIRMKVTESGYEPSRFYLKPGVPIRWVIDGQVLTACNQTISMPSTGLELKLTQGQQVIELPPQAPGTLSWGCWMGMIPGVFVVEERMN